MKDPSFKNIQKTHDFSGLSFQQSQSNTKNNTTGKGTKYFSSLQHHPSKCFVKTVITPEPTKIQVPTIDKRQPSNHKYHDQMYTRTQLDPYPTVAT